MGWLQHQTTSWHIPWSPIYRRASFKVISVANLWVLSRMWSVFSLLVTFLMVPRNYGLSTPQLGFLGIYNYCTFDLNWQPLNWGSFVLGFCPCNRLRFWSYPTVHWLNCGIGLKTESIAWVEVENKASPIQRWGDERVVVVFTLGF